MFIFNVQDGPDEIMESHGRGMDILKAAGVPVVYHKICKTKEEVVRAIDEIGRMREELPYDIAVAFLKIDILHSDRSSLQEASIQAVILHTNIHRKKRLLLWMIFL